MKMILLYTMAILFIAAGLTHFIKPKMYQRIMPPWLPAPAQLVFVTGVMEIVLGILLLFSTTCEVAAWGIIVFLILVFPANIQMAINFRKRNNPYLWVALLRLPLQFLLIWWAWQYT